jgi:hypothetical protein
VFLINKSRNSSFITIPVTSWKHNKYVVHVPKGQKGRFEAFHSSTNGITSLNFFVEFYV